MDKTKIKNTAIQLTVIIAIAVLIPVALGSHGDDATKIKKLRDQAILQVASYTDIVCNWEVELLKEKIKQAEKPDDMISLATQMKNVQIDCAKFTAEQVAVFRKSAKTIK